jgi:hypothetical protein
VRSTPTLRAALAWLALAAIPVSAAGAAHEIPNDVTVHVYVRPDGERLQVLVRVPIEAMHDIEWPTRGPGYLDLDRAAGRFVDAARVWIAGPMEFDAEGRHLDGPRIVAARASLPSDPSFASYDGALAHLRGPPLDRQTNLYWNQALLDIGLEYTIESDTARFAMRPGFERLGLRVSTVVRLLSTDGSERMFHFEGDPGRVVLDPRWYQAWGTFVRLGFDHILGGLDHLVFLLCLVIPIRKVRPLVLVVTAFTVGHSITLAAAVYGVAPTSLWFPPLVEMLIALSIVAMAIGNIIRPEARHRWAMALAFGLVHGFGFSFALDQTMQLAGDHAPAALFAFNLGVELGQLGVIAALVPAVWMFLKLGTSERIGTIVLSALAGHVAWHWMVDRGASLAAYSWPGVSIPSLATAIEWTVLMGLVVAGLVAFSLLAGRARSGSASSGKTARFG